MKETHCFHEILKCSGVADQDMIYTGKEVDREQSECAGIQLFMNPFKACPGDFVFSLYFLKVIQSLKFLKQCLRM